MDVVKLFSQRWGWKYPEPAVDAALKWAFPHLQKMTPPIDVYALARQRNVVSIQKVPLAVDGTISLTETLTYEIELNESQSPLRQRFTCAHEIGHTFFMELYEYPEERRRISDTDIQTISENRQEEFLCNLFASEMLMPHLPFVQAIRTLGISAASIVSISKLFRTSLWSTARRVVDRMELDFKTHIFVACWQQNADLQSYSTRWIVQPHQRRRVNSTLFFDRSTPAYSKLHNMDHYRGRTWISLSGPISDYLIDAVSLKATEPRQLLTVIVFDKRSENALDKISAPKAAKQTNFLTG